MNDSVIKEYCQAIKGRVSQGDYANGLMIADKLIYAFPDSEKGYYYKGVCFFGLQRFQESVACYKSALKINPLDAKSYFNLGTSYQQLKDYDSALINIGKALILFSKQNKQDSKEKCADALKFIEYERNGA